MNKTLKKQLDKLSEKDLFMNEDVRLTYIDGIVSKLKRGIFPTQNLERMEYIIKRHNRIKNMNNDMIKLDVQISDALDLRQDEDRIARADGKTDARKD